MSSDLGLPYGYVYPKFIQHLDCQFEPSFTLGVPNWKKSHAENSALWELERRG